MAEQTVNNSFVIATPRLYWKKREIARLWNFFLLIFLKIFVRYQTESDICKVLCPVFEACKSVVSFFSLSSPIYHSKVDILTFPC